MAKHREELIQQYQTNPLEIGTEVYVVYNDTRKVVSGKGKNKTEVTETYSKERAIVISLNPLTFHFNKGSQNNFIAKETELNNPVIVKTTRHIGHNPFKKSIYGKLRSGASHLYQLLGKKENPYKDDKGNVIQEFSFDPYVMTKDGERYYYQRELVERWTLEKKRKLLDAIFNGLDCGKIILRKRDFGWVVKNNHIPGTAFYDIVDGKQRLNALLEFFQDKWTDSNGMYFSDYTDIAKNKLIEGHPFFQWFEIDDEGDATDEDVINIFLGTNDEGVPQTPQHISYVREILNKIKEDK